MRRCPVGPFLHRDPACPNRPPSQNRPWSPSRRSFPNRLRSLNRRSFPRRLGSPWCRRPRNSSLPDCKKRRLRRSTRKRVGYLPAYRSRSCRCSRIRLEGRCRTRSRQADCTKRRSPRPRRKRPTRFPAGTYPNCPRNPDTPKPHMSRRRCNVRPRCTPHTKPQGLRTPDRRSRIDRCH
jgi:hypothetical protein